MATTEEADCGGKVAEAEEEIRAMIAQGAERGVIREAEEDIVHQVFHLGDRMGGSWTAVCRSTRWATCSTPRDSSAITAATILSAAS
jgi:CBS domain containing-hemolysin-like protein